MALFDFLSNKKKTDANTPAAPTQAPASPMAAAAKAPASPMATPAKAPASPMATPTKTPTPPAATAKPPVPPVAATKPPVPPAATTKPLVESSTEIKATGELQVVIAGASIDFYDDKPYIEGSEVMVPIRELATHLGAKIEWDAATKTAALIKDDDKVEFTPGTAMAKVNGKSTPTGVVATIKNERIFVPIKFLAESLGASYQYDATKKIASIF